jgi:glycosyltransferase involved in cell wall biosynthesis
MRILMLCNCAAVEFQGSGYVIVNTAKSLMRAGHKVDIIPPSSFSFLSSWKARAVIYRMALGMALWVYKNRKAIRNYDFIILYGAESAIALFILKKITRANIPMVLHSNGLEIHAEYQLAHFHNQSSAPKKWYHIDKSFLFKYCYENVNAIITVSKYDRDFAVTYLQISADKVHYNEPGLPEIFFDNDIIDTQTKKRIITYCGSWIERKGVESIKTVIPKILQEFPDYIFRIIGVGNGFDVTAHFPRNILERIEIYPLVDSKERMIELYSESSIFLFPSFFESFGLVIAEAMFCGCAVITGPTGFAADILDKEEAIVLGTPDADNVHKAITTLISDKLLADSLGEKGKSRTQKLNWKNYSDNLNHILEDVMYKFAHQLN